MTQAYPTPFPRAWAEINLPAFERNIGKIKASLPEHVSYISVVKADAYGHGVAHIVERLLQCGINRFAVANAREGADVRYIAPQAEIDILGPTLPEEIPQAIADRLTVAVSDERELCVLADFAQEQNRRARINVAIDTGMGRMGIWHENADRIFSAVAENPHLNWRGVFTHFSSADSSREYTELQRSRFLTAVGKIPSELRERLTIHADNSAGLETFSRERPFNAVRVGILQYGWQPAPGTLFEKISPEPVLSFKTRVGLVKKLPEGTPVSYNRTFTLKKSTKIAVLTAGYGDGIPTAASNRAEVLISGRRVPVIGRVTMDQTLVDADALPGLAVGDAATLIGKSGGECISIEEFCSRSDCIPWEALVSITKRVPRIYCGLRK